MVRFQVALKADSLLRFVMFVLSYRDHWSMFDRCVKQTHLEGKELEFKVIKLDQKRNNVVVSRRAVLEQENSAEREALLESLQEGQGVKGYR